ncbi:MAG: DUF805 domain-containing protein [Veillonella sp.]|uniref:DUF805 domain-containing protein n=1 Tax=Veillonella sp. TaxID=1926307 RepID=UPI0025ED253B|nr:DUF805 domain-containing protein [Veillonella sp.]MBS4913146.1 DUF805 domain-containing protein [Veillonella sp.]
MFCAKCGTEVRDGAVFCPGCGNRLDQEGALTRGGSQVQSNEYNQQQPNGYQQNNNYPQNNSYSQNNSYPQNANFQQQGVQPYEQQPYGQQPYGQPGIGYNTSDPNWVSAPPFIENVKMIFTKKYVDFNGRATRKEYWTYVLAYVVMAFLIGFIGGVLFGDDGDILIDIFLIASFLPNLALTARRLHDSGRSGLWVIGTFIPVLNIVVFIFTLLGSNPGPNQYGPLPVFDAARNIHIYK